MMIHAEITKNFDFFSEEYTGLFQQAGATAFQSPVWLDKFYTLLAQHRKSEPLIICLRNNGRLVGVLPLLKRYSKGLYLIESADMGVSDYSAPILDPSIIIDEQLRMDLVKLFGKHDFLRIKPVRAQHLELWKNILDVKPVRLNFSAHAVELAPPFEEWREKNLDKKIGGMIARKGRRWKKQHEVKFERLADSRAIELAIRNLAKLREGRFSGDPISDKQVLRFYSEVAILGAENGFSETWLATSYGNVAAVVFGVIHEDGFHYLLIGADYENQSRHSPGMQMYDWIIKDWMNRGGLRFDFTIGDEPFKTQFGTKPTDMYSFLRGNSVLGKAAVMVLKRQIATAIR